MESNSSRYRLFSFFSLGTLISLLMLSAEQVIYVSPAGDDLNSGRLESPLRTFDKISSQIRNTVLDQPGEDIVVVFRDGRYQLNEPWVLRSTDWPQGEVQVTLRAFPGESPILSGGWTVDDWKLDPDGLLRASVAGYPGNLMQVRELFVNGKRATRARYPNDDFLRVEASGPDRRTGFTFYPDDIAQIEDFGSAELVFFHDWSTSRVGIKEIDTANRYITLADPIGPVSPHFAIDNFEKHPRYYLEHSRSFLTQPGEWYLDTIQKEVTYMPLPGENLENIHAAVPLSSQLIRVLGTSEQPFKGLHIQGLIMEHCLWAIPANGYAGGQATYHERRYGEGGALRESMVAAVEFQYAQDCSFEGNTLRKLGGSGLLLGVMSSGNRIAFNRIHDVSGNGIMIGEDQSRDVLGKPWWQSAPEQVTRDTQVVGNVVEYCGVQYFGAVGIWVGLAQGTQIDGNTIRELPYTGISLGWMWSEVPTPAARNQIRNNHIHHVMQVLSDGGGIYTLGSQPESLIHGNLIHDVPLNLGRAESNGMFLDQGTMGFIVKENVIYNIDRSPLRFHLASTNQVEKNRLFLSTDQMPPIRFNNTPEEKIHLSANEVIVQSIPKIKAP